jgi:hypothetical protein
VLPVPGLVNPDLFLVVYVILLSHCARGFTQGLGYAHSALQGVNLPKDAAKREANRARNGKLRA